MEIIIRRVVGSLANEIYITKRTDSRILVFNFKDGECVINSRDKEDMSVNNLKPSFILPEEETRELISAFSQLAKNNGLSADDNFIKGKLEAVENHLSDMRRIVFKNTP